MVTTPHQRSKIRNPKPKIRGGCEALAITSKAVRILDLGPPGLYTGAHGPWTLDRGSWTLVCEAARASSQSFSPILHHGRPGATSHPGGLGVAFVAGTSARPTARIRRLRVRGSRAPKVRPSLGGQITPGFCYYSPHTQLLAHTAQPPVVHTHREALGGGPPYPAPLSALPLASPGRRVSLRTWQRARAEAWRPDPTMT